MRVGVVHTVAALAPRIDALLRSGGADLDPVHVVDASLLSRSVAARGVPDDVRRDLAGHLRALRAAGAQAVLVTCSSIGEAADDEAERAGIPLTRLDQEMARRAVERAVGLARARGRTARIAVLATLTTTLDPTARLLARHVGDRTDVEVTGTVVDGAAQARGAGDDERHDALIAAELAATDADVVVLAQASMAAAAAGDRRALSSPDSGVAAFVAQLVPTP